jgi:Domain of unknown function (DUF222)
LLSHPLCMVRCMVTAFATRPPRTFADDVREIDEFFRVLVGRIDPDAVPLCEVTDLWAALDTIERRAASTKLLLARRVEEAGRWNRDGHRSAAEQLAAIAGTSVAAARNQLETSKRVRKLPATEQALRAGKLSGAKAEAIAAAAEVAPEAEADLLDGAEDAPLAVIRERCLRARAKDRDAAHARIRKGRSLKEFPDAEGGWNVVVRGPVEAGAAFRAAHRPIVDELFTTARAEGRREPYEAYAFDAFIELARRAANDTSATGETPTTGPGAEAAPAKAKATPAGYLGIIRIDHTALRRGSVEGDEVCEIVGLGPIPVSVARGLLGDAILKLVITKGVDIANVTHLGRSATVAQQVALWWKSAACTVLGCTRTQRLQNDHRHEWAKTKRTRVDELDPLCKHHHDLKTRHNWALIEGDRPRPMVPPDNPRHPTYRPPPERKE